MIVGQAIQHIVAAGPGSVGILERIEIVRRLRQGGEIGGLRDRKLMHGLAVVIQRCRGDAVISETKIDFVEIKLENLLLGIGALDSE